MQEEYLRLIADDPKQFLSRNYKIEMRIKSKRDRIEHLQNICQATTQELKPVVVYTGPSNKIERYMSEAIDLETEILREIAELKRMQRETAEAIQTLLDDITLITLMEKRYLSDMRWEEIAVDMNYAYRWVMRLHVKALKQMKQSAKSRLKCSSTAL